MPLSPQEQTLAEHRIPGKRKSVLLAYLAWVLAGAAGGHRFYLGKGPSGAVMLLLLVLGLVTLSAGVGATILAGVWFWALVDAILIPNMVQDKNAAGQGSLTLHSLPRGSLVGLRRDATKWWHADRQRYLQQNELPHG